MTLKIITPESIIFSGDVSLVTLPGKYGYFNILENHAPLITTLKKGMMSYQLYDEQIIENEVEAGVVEVSNNTVTICLELIN